MLSTKVSVETDADAASAVRDGTRAALMDASNRGFEVSQSRVPYDRGGLSQSGFPPEERPNGSIVWGYGAKHARPIEEGTGPFTPPIEPLLEWGRRVLGSRSAGAAVWQKIRREGIDANPYVQPGINAMTAQLRAKGISAFISRRL